MEKNDTDPDGDRAFDDVRDRTEPDPPRDEPVGQGAELLAKLSDIALPEDRVAETKGHYAAQFAAAPHAPPPRRPDAPSQPSVLVNVTAPLPPPAPVAPPVAVPVASPEDRIAVVLPRDADPNTTVISPHRKRGNARIVAGAAVFATTVVVIAALASRAAPRSAPSSDPPASSSALPSIPASTVATSIPPTVLSASAAPVVSVPSITSVASTPVAATASPRTPAVAKPHVTSAPPVASASPSARAPSPDPSASDDPDFGLFQRKRQ